MQENVIRRLDMRETPKRRWTCGRKFTGQRQAIAKHANPAAPAVLGFPATTRHLLTALVLAAALGAAAELPATSHAYRGAATSSAHPARPRPHVMLLGRS